jgi:hypothetical protein
MSSPQTTPSTQKGREGSATFCAILRNLWAVPLFAIQVSGFRPQPFRPVSFHCPRMSQMWVELRRIKQDNARTVPELRPR